MSALDDWGVLSDACPKCGNSVEWWYFSSTDPYGPADFGNECTKCKYRLTPEELKHAKETKPSEHD